MVFLLWMNDSSDALSELIKESTKGIKLPKNNYSIYKRNTARSRFSRNTGKAATGSDARATIWSKKALSSGYSQNKQLDTIRQDYTIQLSKQWAENLKDRKYLSLKQDIDANDQNISDYISTWNHTRLNLNTAPAEVIYAVFEPIGMTMAMVDTLVDFRKDKPLARSNMFALMPGLEPVSGALTHLYTDKSDTFTIRVTARLGQAQYKLYSCTIKNKDGKVENLAVYTGD